QAHPRPQPQRREPEPSVTPTAAPVSTPSTATSPPANSPGTPAAGPTTSPGTTSQPRPRPGSDPVRRLQQSPQPGITTGNAPRTRTAVQQDAERAAARGDEAEDAHGLRPLGRLGEQRHHHREGKPPRRPPGTHAPRQASPASWQSRTPPTQR